MSGAIGTALLAVFLQRAIAARAPREHGDLQQMATLPHEQHVHAHGLIVLTLAGDRISAITRFLDNSVLPQFGLPRTLPG